LIFLGYQTAGEVAQLPSATLKGQFGDTYLRIKSTCLGQWHDRVHPGYPLDSLERSFTFPGGIDNVLALDAGLQQLAEAFGDALVARERQAMEVRMFFEMESGEIREKRRRFQKAIRCQRTALASFRLLANMIPEEEMIFRIRVLLPDLKVCPRIQKDLLDHTPTDQRRLSAESAFQAIRTVYGDRAIQEGKDVLLPRRARLLREWKQSLGWD
jgi:hypothetical protein